MSRFIEMFGTVESTKPLTDFIEVSFPGEWGQEDKDGSGVKVIRTTNFTNNGKLDLSDVVTRDIDSVKVEKKKLSKGDIILERSGGTNENPVGSHTRLNQFFCTDQCATPDRDNNCHDHMIQSDLCLVR